jgi:hypothetical protein
MFYLHFATERRAAALELEAGSRHAGGMKDSIVRIYVTLLDVDPAIWRRIEVPDNFTLELRLTPPLPHRYMYPQATVRRACAEV